MSIYYQQRMEVLASRIANLAPRLDRAHQTVQRLEAELAAAPVLHDDTSTPTRVARAARLSAARSMAETLLERERQLRVALAALQAEVTSADAN
jgi:hypothetical protein